MVADAESVLIFVRPPEGYLDDALQAANKLPAVSSTRRQIVGLTLPQRNVEPIDDRRFHPWERMPLPGRARDPLRRSAPALP